jgi:hypothetical protein
MKICETTTEADALRVQDVVPDEIKGLQRLLSDLKDEKLAREDRAAVEQAAREGTEHMYSACERILSSEAELSRIVKQVDQEPEQPVIGRIQYGGLPAPVTCDADATKFEFGGDVPFDMSQLDVGVNAAGIAYLMNGPPFDIELQTVAGACISCKYVCMHDEESNTRVCAHILDPKVEASLLRRLLHGAVVTQWWQPAMLPSPLVFDPREVTVTTTTSAVNLPETKSRRQRQKRDAHATHKR